EVLWVNCQVDASDSLISLIFGFEPLPPPFSSWGTSFINQSITSYKIKEPPSPLNSAINQSAVLLEKEVSRANNEKKKQKRTRSIRTIVYKGNLLV
ncbi:hypothetical protein N7519_002637, partial [Penicillium mononematosum]|uniref:uncharacterized protein n=1 Tax=Penicillium mononematosum TaxID=268346 RepID=UPI0025488DD1